MTNDPMDIDPRDPAEVEAAPFTAEESTQPAAVATDTPLMPEMPPGLSPNEKIAYLTHGGQKPVTYPPAEEPAKE